jgi:hypothetical protein
MHSKIYVNRLRKTLKGKTVQSQGDCQNQVHSDQMVLETVRWEAGPCKRQAKTLTTKLSQGGRSGKQRHSKLSYLKGGDQAHVHSDQMVLGQAGGWVALTMGKGTQGESWKTTVGSQET